MAAQAIRSGVSIAREAIGNTGKGERALYGLLVGAGVILVIIGWRTDGNGWTTAHPYLAGLLVGATGFCFGVPVAGIVIREITRRASQSAELRNAARAITSQLDYLDQIVEGLSPGPIMSASDRLRELGQSARSAMPSASVHAKETEGKAGVRFWVVSVDGSAHALGMQPKMRSATAAELRGVVEGDKLWASVGFGCGRLGGDVTRLVPILYLPTQSRQAMPGWLDELTSVLQTLLVLQLPVHRRWLPAAVKDPPELVPVTLWSSQMEAGVKWAGLSFGGQEDQKPDSVTADVTKAAQEKATSEFKGELLALAYHLETLAAFVDAAGKCRSELSPLDGRSRQD
jgi:hypothetical protein